MKARPNFSNASKTQQHAVLVLLPPMLSATRCSNWLSYWVKNPDFTGCLSSEISGSTERIRVGVIGIGSSRNPHVFNNTAAIPNPTGPLAEAGTAHSNIENIHASTVPRSEAFPELRESESNPQHKGRDQIGKRSTSHKTSLQTARHRYCPVAPQQRRIPLTRNMR